MPSDRTFFNSQVRELSYIHSRDATYATLCKGPYEESVRYRDFLGLDVPWYSVEKTAVQLLEGRDWQRPHLVCYVRDGERVLASYSESPARDVRRTASREARPERARAAV